MRTLGRFFLLIVLGVAAQASVIATGQLSLNQLSITPAAGVVEFLEPWSIQTFAEARNSLGELDSEFSVVGGSNASVTYGNASGTADPILRTAQAQSSSALPGTVTANSSATGRGGLAARFQIVGGSGPVSTQFVANIEGSIFLSTDALGQLAESEIIFTLTVDGNNVLFERLDRSIGPNESFQGSLTATLSSNEMLQYGTIYSLLLEIDSESRGVNIPEPPLAGLILLGFTLILYGTRKTRLRAWTVVPPLLLAVLQAPLAQAKYKGGEPPVCRECEEPCGDPRSYVPGGSEIGLSEGNLRERIAVADLRSASGPTVRFILTYNSYNADDSRAAIDTVLGYGWTHSYNIFLFSQRGHMFRP